MGLNARRPAYAPSQRHRAAIVEDVFVLVSLSVLQA
jgi:hypothetical protein